MRLQDTAPNADIDPADIDLLDPDLYGSGDPHAVWAVMRRRCPVYRHARPDGLSFVSVTRHVDAVRVLGDHRDFTSTRGSLVHQLGQPEPAAGSLLVVTDPPEHARLRRHLNAALSPSAVTSWEPHIRKVVRGLLPDIDGVWDAVDIGERLAMAVAGRLLGLPEEEWEQLVTWTNMAASPHDGNFCVRSPTVTLGIAHHSLFEYLTRAVEHRRRSRADDLLADLVADTSPRWSLSDAEIVYTCYSVLLGANATTPHTIAGALLALVEYGEGRSLPRELVAGFVEEGLRWTSPANSFLRHAVRDVDLDGGRVQEGEAVAVWIGSANRDERVFDEPFHFDASRRDKRHLAFGFGAHYCSGAAVARLTLRVFFEELFDWAKAVECAGPATHLSSVFVAGFTRSPMRAILRHSSPRSRL